jgi:hypothetical protein
MASQTDAIIRASKRAAKQRASEQRRATDALLRESRMTPEAKARRLAKAGRRARLAVLLAPSTQKARDARKGE